MSRNRRAAIRPYFFEVFTIVNLLLVHLLLVRRTGGVLTTLPSIALIIGPALVIQCIAGVAIRWAVLRVRGGAAGAYLRIVRSLGWLLDTLRLLLFGVLMVHAYAWIKLVVPVLHPALYDQQLWDLDRNLFFGLSPNVFFLSLFSHPLALGTIDWTYANIFVASMNIAFAFFLSAPSRRFRVAFADGNTAMWLIGAWLYMLLPSIGPAYRFPDVWLALAPLMPRTHELQTMLIQNYQVMQRFGGGAGGKIEVLYGVAAFPSLHVAFQMFAVLWMRKVWRYGEVVFGVFLLFIFLGSVVTGWHYLIDSYAGLVLAIACYLPIARHSRIGRWVR
ncbi:MAG TPA: phosphatase PAP2 family protein [Thermoanaerobaculia bacterium]|nr:phosphatase PAP2 family protein [Thermoanaerobaculia bacterium]